MTRNDESTIAVAMQLKSDEVKCHNYPQECEIISRQCLAGTIDYAPPEQMDRSVDGKVWETGKHSDVFSFSKTMKFLLFGKLEPHIMDY